MGVLSEAERLRPNTWVAWNMCYRIHRPRHPFTVTARNNTPGCRLLPIHRSSVHLPLVILSNVPDSKRISLISTLNQIKCKVLTSKRVHLRLCPTTVLTATKHDSRPIAFKQEII